MNKDCENFRAVVLASGATLALAAAYDVFATPYSEELRSLLSWGGFDSLLPFEATNLMFLAWLFVYAIAHVLSFFFVHYARWLIVASLFIGLVMAVVSGALVSGPVSVVLWSIHYTIQPFFIGMAFFAPPVLAAFRGDASRVARQQPFSQAQSNNIVDP